MEEKNIPKRGITSIESAMHKKALEEYNKFWKKVIEVSMPGLSSKASMYLPASKNLQARKDVTQQRMPWASLEAI